MLVRCHIISPSTPALSSIGRRFISRTCALESADWWSFHLICKPVSTRSQARDLQASLMLPLLVIWMTPHITVGCLQSSSLLCLKGEGCWGRAAASCLAAMFCLSFIWKYLKTRTAEPGNTSSTLLFVNSSTTIGPYMAHRFSWALFKLNSLTAKSVLAGEKVVAMYSIST